MPSASQAGHGTHPGNYESGYVRATRDPLTSDVFASGANCRCGLLC